MPSLQVGDAVYQTGSEKASCIAEAMWPNCSHGAAAHPLPEVYINPDRKTYASCQIIAEHEVPDLLQDLKKRKAMGPDRVPNEAFKYAKKLFVNPLRHFFQACLIHSYHPAEFKGAITITLRKPDKETYAHPKSWRPVALLSCLGKMLEKLIANRLQELVRRHDMLPSTQFGAPGRSTTGALEYLLNIVYRGWNYKKNHRKVSLLSLDIKGAFDNVDRVKLLQVLLDKGVPDWIFKFVRSFLSDRSTSFQLPGYKSDPFWVNIGIPQGSPLSPILFLFFASPIIEQFENESCGAIAETYVFAYVDDTYFLVLSQSYERNCRLLKTLHDRLIGWATPYGISFSPAKYAVMHFRRPRSRGRVCTLLPDIPGLAVKEHLKTVMRVLGLFVDHKVQRKDHIAVVSETEHF